MIGIIGQGFVGNAVYQKFKNYYDILTNDLDETKSIQSVPNLPEESIESDSEIVIVEIPDDIGVALSIT